MSDRPDLAEFRPHKSATAAKDDLLVWAVDTRHLPLYWFPRDCPRMTFWADPTSTDEDVERLLLGDRRSRVHVIEGAWLDRLLAAELVAYEMPRATFKVDAPAMGNWTSTETVIPLHQERVNDLLGLHIRAGIELRIVGNLWPVVDRVVASSLEFSGIRLRNANPRT